jgi:hypothetical protein
MKINPLSVSVEQSLSAKNKEIGELIFDLARNLTHSSDSVEYESWSDKMTQIVAFELSAKNNENIDHALQIARDCQDMDTHDEIIFNVEFEAENRTLEISNQQPPIATFLFAIPVILSGAEEMQSGKIPNGKHYEFLRKSFFSSGVVSDGPKVTLVNYLYHSDEIEKMSWSDVYYLSHSMLHQNTKQEKSDDEVNLGQLGWPKEIFSPSNVDGVALRFLIGVVCDNIDSDDPLMAPSDEEGIKLWIEKMSAWRDSATIHLNNSLSMQSKNVKGIVGPIGMFYDTFRVGRANFKLIEMMQLARQISKETGLDPQKMNVIVDLYFCENNEIEAVATMISQYDDSVLAYLKMPIDESEDGFEVIKDIALYFTNFGVIEIQVNEEIQSEKQYYSENENHSESDESSHAKRFLH